MPDWDEESSRLRRNLTNLLRQIRDEARTRQKVSLDSVRHWHKVMLQGLAVPLASMRGRFRGERDLEDIEIEIGPHFGVNPGEVASEVAAFVQTLQRVAARLDELIPPDTELDADQLAAVLDVCAWAHAEWIRIHPFANGNGRTARLWANYLAMRYGLPPFVRLRPRPDGGYGTAGEAAMRGDWQQTVMVFRRMLDDVVRK
jgi:Fic family protein